LHDERCLAQCPEKYRPTFNGKECEKEGELPVIYFPLCILCCLAGGISFGGQFSSKNVYRQHKIILSFYAMVGIIDVLCMWFQFICTCFQGQYWMMIPVVIALIVNYYLNYKYIAMWNIIDPEKPEDEEALNHEEVRAINDCDENFDKWNTKYFSVGNTVRLCVKFLSHKFFSMPFTHFFGYLHFTVRYQDYKCMWQWDPKEVINYNKRQLSLKQISNPKFKFRGKLAAQKKAGGFM